MRWTRHARVLTAAGALFAAGCNDQLPTDLNPGMQAAKQPSPLKVTPSQINFLAVGGTATLSVTPGPSSETVAVTVSTPACVSVSNKSVQKNQTKFTVTATAAGSCTLTVSDGSSNVAVPVTVPGSSLVAGTLAAGVFHTCGLTANGAAYCWGFNGAGQLGNATTAGSTTANPTPEAVVGGIAFASLTAGFQHTCGLTSAGVAYCWGDNTYGQLGNSANVGVQFQENPTPLLVDGNLTFTVLEAGVDHTCGLTAQGVMYCWGNNRLGQLGTATNNLTTTPNQTPTAVPGGLTFIGIAGGTLHTCGIATGGSVYCWGENTKGQLGNSTDIGQENVPHPTPVLVQGLPALVSLDAGGYHNCGLTSAGAAWCWGDNFVGHLSGTTDPVSATPVAVSGGLVFTSIDVGGGQSCGLTSAGTMYCWGGNLLGQLGTSTNFGTNNPNYSPIAVSGLTFATIAANSAHTCGVTAAGQAWCWGFNRYGQLGNTTNNDTDTGVPTPTAVIGGLVFVTP
ncbi:MAG TPA: hypothetical protein VJU17_09055 [Gemmatimonadales bacterium]|nr:hypothetical protein [Gemmatimonadales bacterium]